MKKEKITALPVDGEGLRLGRGDMCVVGVVCVCGGGEESLWVYIVH